MLCCVVVYIVCVVCAVLYTIYIYIYIYTPIELEGEYRSAHSDLQAHAEEIAFYKGDRWELSRITASFKRMQKHFLRINYQKFYMGAFDNILVKYGATIIGYIIVSLPLFGPERFRYMDIVHGDTSIIVKDYIRNSKLLISLAKAVGQLVASYKEIQNLAAYTTLVSNLLAVLNDLEQGKYLRKNAGNQYMRVIEEEKLLGGRVVSGRDIGFEGVPVIAPNGHLLIPNMNFIVHSFIRI